MSRENMWKILIYLLLYVEINNSATVWPPKSSKIQLPSHRSDSKTTVKQIISQEEIEEISKNIEEIWNSQSKLLTQTKKERLKRASKTPNKPTSNGSNKTMSTTNTTISDSSIQLVQQTILRPLVAVSDTLTRTSLIQMNPLLFITLILVRTVTAIIDGTLDYVMSPEANSELQQNLRDILEDIFANPSN